MPVQPASSLRQRARQASSAELAGIPWLALLDADDRHAAAAALQVSDADPGDRVCRHGAPGNYWFGVVDGPPPYTRAAPSLGWVFVAFGAPTMMSL